MARSEKKKFEYKPRSAEQLKKRATQKSGAYDSYLDDKVALFKPKPDTEYSIRIFPPTWEDPTHFGVDIHVHYGIGSDNNSYLCLERMKVAKVCPICVEKRKAESEGNEEYARELSPTRRVLVWMIDRDKEGDGPIAWAMPNTVDTEINRRAIHKKTGEALQIDNPEDGYDVAFTREGNGFKTKYVGVDIDRHSSLLSEDPDTYDKWMDFVVENPLTEMLVYHDADYISGMFGGATEGASESAKPSKPTRAAKPAPVDEDEEEEEEEEAPPPPRRSTRAVAPPPPEDDEEEEEEEDTPLPDKTPPKATRAERAPASKAEESGKERLARLRRERGGG